MNTAKSILRVLILIALTGAAMFLIFSEPTQADLSDWLLSFFITKFFGLLSAIAVGYLYRAWSKSDKWISAYEKAYGAAGDTEL